MVSEGTFLSFVAGLLDVPADSLSLETAYGTLAAWDSVMHLRLVLEIEKKYQIEIPLEEISNITTLGQFYSHVIKPSK